MNTCMTVFTFVVGASFLVLDIWAFRSFNGLRVENPKRTKVMTSVPKILRAVSVASSGERRKGGFMKLRKTALSIVFLVLLPFTARAQTDRVNLNPNPIPYPPGDVSAMVFGGTGAADCHYWVDAVYPQGETDLAGVEVKDCPNTLSSSDFVRVVWKPQSGALSYNVLKYSTKPVSGTVLVGSTSNAWLDDTGQALSAWQKPTSFPDTSLYLIGKAGQVFTNALGLLFSGPASISSEGTNQPVTLTPTGTADVVIGKNGLKFPDGTEQTTAAQGAVVASADLLTQVSSISDTTIYVPSVPGMYRVSIEFFETDAGSGTVTASVKWTQSGSGFTKSTVASASASAGTGTGSGSVLLYSDANYAIMYNVSFSPSTAPYHYDAHIRVEQVE